MITSWSKKRSDVYREMQGFIDQHCTFHTSEEAYIIAAKNDQLNDPHGHQP